MDGGREGFISEFYWVWLRRTLTFTIPKGPVLTGSFSQPNAMHLATLLPSSVNRDSRHRLVPGATKVEETTVKEMDNWKAIPRDNVILEISNGAPIQDS